MNCSAAPTLLHHLVDRARAAVNEDGVHYKQAGSWQRISYPHFAEQVAKLACWMKSRAVQPGDRVLLMSENGLPWMIADLAIQAIGAVCVPLHVTSPAVQLQSLSRRVAPRLALVSKASMAASLSATGDSNPVPEVITFDDAPTEAALPLAEILSRSDLADPLEYLSKLADELDPETPATIVFTSGTSCEPRGVMLSHRNLCFAAEALVNSFGTAAARRRFVALPLSHLLARTADFFCWTVMGGELAIISDPSQLMADLAQIRPTYITGVPRLFARIAAGLEQNNLANLPGILPKVLGGEIRACTCGGAPLSEELAQFYASRGVPLLEGYGLTEAAPVVSLNTTTSHKPKTVGQALPGTEIRLASDGEILVRGDHVMQGYWNDPTATAAAIQNGWLLTGDFGTIDNDGFLSILGRKKEMLVTSGGRNVFPATIEARLCEHPLLWHAMLVGDGKSSLAALLVVDTAQLSSLLPTSESLDIDQLSSHPRVRELMANLVLESLADRSPHEVPRRLHLLPGPWRDPQDRITPKGTLARGAMLDHYAAVIEQMYREPIWPELVSRERSAV